MTEADLIHVYRTRAQTRLETAGSSLQRHPECQFELGMDSDLTRSDIAMRVWSAAVDIGSALMLQETHMIPNGRSTEITQFVSRTLHRQKPLMGFNVLWSTLVQLHNIQHRGYHDLSRFRSVARDANRSVSALNWALHPNNRLAPESYGWLVRVRQDFRNVFRDGSTDQIVDFAQTASVSAPLTESDQYPLHWAAGNLDPTAITILIDNGAMIDARDRTQRTALHWAARTGTPEAVRELLLRGSDVADGRPGPTPLHYAASSNSYDTVLALVDNGADVNASDPISAETPLHQAARSQEDASVLQLLLNRGADRAIANLSGQTAYDVAVASGAYFESILMPGQP